MGPTYLPASHSPTCLPRFLENMPSLRSTHRVLGISGKHAPWSQDRTSRTVARTCAQNSGTSRRQPHSRLRPYLEHEAFAAREVQHGLQREVAQACVVGPALGHLGEEAADALGGRSRYVDAPLHHEHLSRLDRARERSRRPECHVVLCPFCPGTPPPTPCTAQCAQPKTHRQDVPEG